MKKILFLITVLCFIAFSIEAKKPANLRYDIECAGNGIKGTSLVKVWVYGNPDKITPNEIKKYAVHGVIFKGYAGNSSGCTAQKPLAQSPALEQEKAGFFDVFFNSDKAYAKYVTEVDETTERVKVGKEYKIGAIVSVSTELLRKDLEAAGIIRKLSDGF